MMIHREVFVMTKVEFCGDGSQGGRGRGFEAETKFTGPWIQERDKVRVLYVLAFNWLMD